jgi:hypothetical protein
MSLVEELVLNVAATKGGEESLWEMTRQYEQFERDGYIGSCLLRMNAGLLCEELYGDSSKYVVDMMEKIVFHIYKFFANKYKNFSNSQKDVTDSGTDQRN